MSKSKGQGHRGWRELRGFGEKLVGTARTWHGKQQGVGKIKRAGARPQWANELGSVPRHLRATEGFPARTCSRKSVLVAVWRMEWSWHSRSQGEE